MIELNNIQTKQKNIFKKVGRPTKKDNGEKREKRITFLLYENEIGELDKLVKESNFSNRSDYIINKLGLRNE